VAAPISTAEAYLRVALLVSRADGRESPEEMLVTAMSITERLGEKPVTADELRRATYEVAASPPSEVLVQVSKALPTLAGREQAFRLALEVANADRRLRPGETTQIVDVARALGLKDKDVQRIVGAYWTAPSENAA
jgi:tellurite resistance protein